MKIKILKKYIYEKETKFVTSFPKIKPYFMKNETFSFFASLFRGLNLFEFKLNYSSLAFDSLSVIQI